MLQLACLISTKARPPTIWNRCRGIGSDNGVFALTANGEFALFLFPVDPSMKVLKSSIIIRRKRGLIGLKLQ